MGELLEMSDKEIDRYHILQKVLNKEITQIAAASLLQITDRHIRRLLKKIKKDGKKGVISKHRETRGNHRKPQEFKDLVLDLLRHKYEDFGPTFAKEKLEELDGLSLSEETLRRWMIENHLWIPKKQKRNLHLPRLRKECFGELIQADGSHHKWFGEEFPTANLTVFVDDATGKITSLVFSEGETLDSYLEALKQHLKRYGRPRALYTDRCRVFQSQKPGNTTHMEIALKKLDIRLILARSPQAKGRVERANRTLQDRLMKELKLRGIDTIEGGNAFSGEFIEIYNQKFSKKPMRNFDAHRPLEGFDLDRILCRYETRTLLSDLTFQFNKTLYKVQGDFGGLKGQEVEIRSKNGNMRVFFGEKELKVAPLNQVEERPVLSRKEMLYGEIKERKKPSDLHPWKRYDYHQSVSNRFKRYGI